MNIHAFATDLFNRMNAAHAKHDFNAPPDYSEWLADQAFRDAWPDPNVCAICADSPTHRVGDQFYCNYHLELQKPKQPHLCLDCGCWYMERPAYYSWSVCDDCSPF